MSAPQTNLDKERRRHRGPLIGMAVAVVAVLALFLGWTFWEADEGTPPAGSPTTIDGRTGEPTEDVSGAGTAATAP